MIPVLHEVSINVRYRDGGPKAARWFSVDSSNSISQLMQDLEQLRFPTPRESNVKFVSAGCMKASWICPPNGALYKRLKTLVYRTKSPGFAPFWGSNTTPADLEIVWIALSEVPLDVVQHPNIQPDNDPYVLSHPISGDGQKVKKKARTLNSVVPANCDSSAAFPRSNISLSASTPSTLADAYRPRLACKMSDFKSAAPIPSPNIMIWKLNGSREPNLPREPCIEKQKDPWIARTIDQPISSGSSDTGSRGSSRPASRESASAMPTNMNYVQLPPHLPRRPLANHGSQLSRVTHEGSAIQPSILEPPSQTSQSFADRMKEVESELACEKAARAKLELACNRAQQARRREQEKCAKLEAELATERTKRIEAEDVVKDIRRECRTPFVVPALLETFITVAKLTSWAMDADKASEGL